MAPHASNSVTQARAPCQWDATECILKASIQDKENSVLAAWARGYRLAFTCYPRLHVITNSDVFHRARRWLHGIPNVTYRDNNFSATALAGGTYTIIQWHLLWADNFTSAPHVLFFDVDAVPVMPLRCRHIFDDQERLHLHAWNYVGGPTHWVRPDSAVMRLAQERGEVFPRNWTKAMVDLDFMTVWPIVAPRWVLPHIRRLVAWWHNSTDFDRAFNTLKGSHSDLIGKVAMLLFPDRVSLHLCPQVFNRSIPNIVDEVSLIEGHAPPQRRGSTRADFFCRDRLSPVEHVKHPLQGLHTPMLGVRFKPLFQAAVYAHHLINQSLLYQQGAGEFPQELFHYNEQRRHSNHSEHVVKAWLMPDEPGRTCGLPSGGWPTEGTSLTWAANPPRSHHNDHTRQHVHSTAVRESAGGGAD